MPSENDGFPPEPEPPAVYARAQPAAATTGDSNNEPKDGDDGLEC